MEANSSSENDEDRAQPSIGPTTKAKSNKGKVVITYNKKGVPIGDEATKLSTFEGMVARTMVPITYESWPQVDDELKERLWEYVLMNFAIDPKSRKNTMQSIGTKWKNFKHYLYKNYILKYKDDPGANLLNPPEQYSFLKKDDWKLFVAQRLSKKWEEKSNDAKKIRAKHTYNHRTSRKGYAKLIVEIMEETGMTEEEIDRSFLWKKARELKKGGYSPNVQMVVDRVEELKNSENFEEETCGANDLLTQALGTDEKRGSVRGMGKYVTPHQYFYLPRTVKHYMANENKKYDKRLSKVEGEVEKLKRGVNNVSECASCQMWDNEDFGDEPLGDLVDNSCFLAVDVASNIVAKGTIMKYSSSENIEVMMETCVNGEALLPIPLEDEFILKVKDAVGHILLWPRHLVIRCSDLAKLTAKPVGKHAKHGREEELQSKKDKKRRRERDEEKEKEQEMDARKEKDTGKEKDAGKEKDTGKEKDAGKEKDKVKQNETVRRRTRGQMRKMVRIEKSRVLRMTAHMVDTKVAKVESIKVQCEDSLFGNDSFTYLNYEDFEVVFTLDEMSGSIVTSYMMYLFEEIKNGTKKDHGICFVSPSSISRDGRRDKFKNSDEASRNIAMRLSTRKNNGIILLPYNPGGHWVLGVIDMKTTTCYYLDSLRPSNVNSQLKQIIDAAMVLYGAQSGSNKRVLLDWINVKCPLQPGSTECGYYMLKFMKEIVDNGVAVLVDKNIGDGTGQYTDADIDDLREEWATFVTNFIFR